MAWQDDQSPSRQRRKILELIGEASSKGIYVDTGDMRLDEIYKWDLTKFEAGKIIGRLTKQIKEQENATDDQQ